MALISMTGFGSSEFTYEKFPFSVEIKTLNHRYLDVQFRSPRFLSRFEPRILALVRNQLNRGRVEIMVVLQERKLTKKTYVNIDLAEEIYNSLKKLSSKLELDPKKDKPTLSMITSFREIFQEPEIGGVDEEAFWKKLENGLKTALNQLGIMREKEGNELEKEILERLNQLEGFRKKINDQAMDLSSHYRAKLSKRIKDYMGELNLTSSIDEGRLIQEAGYLAERSDVSEELVRLEGHLKQFRKLVTKGSPVGRKLDFLSQEIYREINTVGTKLNEMGVVQIVIDFKSELEKIREQVQNIE